MPVEEIPKKRRQSMPVEEIPRRSNPRRRGSASSWNQLSCTSRTSSTYSSYHSFGQGQLSEVEVTMMASQQSLGNGFIDRMHMSRQEKDALGNMHGFCFTDSDAEHEDDDDDDKEEDLIL